MTTSLETAQPPAKSSNTRRVIEFDASREGKIGIAIPQNTWDWPRIQFILDEALSLTDKRNTTVLNADIQSLAFQLYPYLPDAKGVLRTIRTKAKGYYQAAHYGTPQAKAILRPYRRQLRALVWAARQKLAVALCLPNQRNWDIRAYRLFLEFQFNLGRLSRVHFLTLTFEGNPCYQLIQERTRRLKRKLKDEGFEAVSVVSRHPSTDVEGRMHTHLLVWTRQTRSPSEDTIAVNKCKAALKSSKSPFGSTRWTTASDRQSFLQISAYMAWNYSQTISLAKGTHNPIPRGARVLGRPRRVSCRQMWTSVGKISLNTPAKAAWRSAVSRYAAAAGRPSGGDLRWIWRERRKIREFLEPENWWDVSVSGLDGHTYQVIPAGEDFLGNEIYLLLGDHRGFYLTESGLEELAALEVAPGALAQNDLLDLTAGKTAYIYDVLGMSWNPHYNYAN